MSRPPVNKTAARWPPGWGLDEMNVTTHRPDPCSAAPAPPYTLAEAAELLRQSESTAKRRRRDGAYPYNCAYKIGRCGPWLLPADDVHRAMRGETR